MALPGREPGRVHSRGECRGIPTSTLPDTPLHPLHESIVQVNVCNLVDVRKSNYGLQALHSRHVGSAPTCVTFV